MSHWITLVTPHGRMNGWAAEPDDKPNGGVVVVPDVFGVNDEMRQVAGRYAQEGYLTVVPALFDKLQREVEMTCEPENYRIGSALADRLGLDTAAELVNTTADAISHAGKVAIVGYGWGGTVALRSAQMLGLPCADYDGLPGPWVGIGTVDVPLLLHHGLDDPRFSPAFLQEFHNRLPSAHVLGYPGNAAFDGQVDSHNPRAEIDKLAFRRTLDFLGSHIRHEND